jgi:hypothetical protein
MSGKTLLEIETPKTQSVEAVKALLSFVGRGADPLPAEISLENGRLMLILSNKKDAYYVTTARDCSCPARSWQPAKPCKHQRRYFPTAKVETARPQEESLMRREPFKPFLESDAKPGKASSSLLIDAYAWQPTEGEVRYWQNKERAAEAV